MKKSMTTSLISEANAIRFLSTIGKTAKNLVIGSKETIRTIEGLTRLGLKAAEVLGISRAKGEAWLSVPYPQNGKIYQTKRDKT